MSLSSPHRALSGRPILIGVGGATSSGKSTLAARLAPLINGTILPQDDFALPESELRYDERIDGKDWDDPEHSVRLPGSGQGTR
jgi:nicotinamide/nicotinate riboside kinase